MKVNIDGEMKNIHTLWREGSSVKLIDQRILPHRFEILTLKDHRDTAEAVKIMILRGAGAIGVAAGYGMAQAALEAKDLTLDEFKEYMDQSADRLRSTRPTAANLFHAIDRCLAAGFTGTVPERVEAVVAEKEYRGSIGSQRVHGAIDRNGANETGKRGDRRVQDQEALLRDRVDRPDRGPDGRDPVLDGKEAHLDRLVP